MPVQQLSSGGISLPVSSVDPTSAGAQGGGQQNANGFNLDNYLKLISNTPDPTQTTSYQTNLQFTPNNGVDEQPWYQTTKSDPFSNMNGGDIPSLSFSDGVPNASNDTSAASSFTKPSLSNAETINGMAPDAGINFLNQISKQGPTGTYTESLYPIYGSSPHVNINPFTGAPDSPEALGFTGAWDGAKTVSGNPYAWDPFSYAGAGEGQALKGEADSPGYKDFGQDWLNLLNTVSSQDLKWGGTNQYSGELKGGGNVGPWLTENILNPWNSNNHEQSYANAIDFISKQTGKPATDPQVQKMGGAFLDYTLQNADRYNRNTKNFDQRKASQGGKDIFGSLLGPLGLATAFIPGLQEFAPFIAAASFGNAASNGDPLGMVTSALGGLGGAFGNIGDLGTGWADALGITNASDIANIASIGSGLDLAGNVAGLGGAISSGDPLGIVGSALGTAFKADNLFGGVGSPAGTAGTNSGSSGGIMSGLANSLGLDSDDINLLKQAVPLAGAGVPLVTALTSSQPDFSPPTQGGGSIASIPAQTNQPPVEVEPGIPGQALSPQAVYNPAQARYKGLRPRISNPNNSNMNPQDILSALGAA